jgi:hypothetical protein
MTVMQLQAAKNMKRYQKNQNKAHGQADHSATLRTMWLSVTVNSSGLLYEYAIARHSEQC